MTQPINFDQAQFLAYQQFLIFQSSQAQTPVTAIDKPKTVLNNKSVKSNSKNKSSSSIEVSKRKSTDEAVSSTAKKQLFASSAQSEMPSHALVLWIEENKYTTVPYSYIQLQDNQSAEDGEIYKTKFNKEFYEAKLIISGSKNACDSHLEQIQKRLDEDEEKEEEKNKTTTTAATTTIKKVSKSESEENQRLKNKNLQLTNENAALKVKLAEVHRHAKDNELIHSKLKDEYNELNNKLEKLKNSFEPGEIDKYLQLSRNFISVLSDSAESTKNTHQVQLHPNFMVFVEPLLHSELISLLNDKNTTTSFIYRKLMFALIPDEAWSSETGNSTTIREKYKLEYGASKAFIQSKRDITRAEDKVFNTTINAMCVDKRRKTNYKKQLNKNSNETSSNANTNDYTSNDINNDDNFMSDA